VYFSICKYGIIDSIFLPQFEGRVSDPISYEVCNANAAEMINEIHAHLLPFAIAPRTLLVVYVFKVENPHIPATLSPIPYPISRIYIP
jgi:hypothetical protein